MIALTDPIRHALAGVLASAAFLTLFFVLSLKAIAAIPVALIVYIGALFATPRRAPPSERMLADGVSEADLRMAVSALEGASSRLESLAERAPHELRGALEEMSARLHRIADHHADDPRDFKHTRRLIRHDLDRLVETCERYVDLAARSDDADAERLGGIAERIRGFAPALAKIERACLDNDFLQLEVEAEVLSDQIGR